MFISWHVPILLSLTIRDVIFPIILKKISMPKGFYERLFLMFLFAFACAVVFFAVKYFFIGEAYNLNFNGLMATLVLMGCLNGLYNLFYWKAIDISLSKTSLFSVHDDIIAMSLSLIILNEFVFLNFGLILGIIMCVTAVVLFIVHDYFKARSNPQEAAKDKSITKIFFFYVLSGNIIRGVITFLMKYLSINDIETGTFLVGWYGFSMVITFVFWRMFRDKKASLQIFSKYNMKIMPLAAMCIVSSLGTLYWAYQLAPQTVVQPIALVSQKVLPTLIGLYLFSENKRLDLKQKLLFVFGISGGIIVALNYSA